MLATPSSTPLDISRLSLITPHKPDSHNNTKVRSRSNLPSNNLKQDTQML
jgi:hypothetical protein